MGHNEVLWTMGIPPTPWITRSADACAAARVCSRCFRLSALAFGATHTVDCRHSGFGHHLTVTGCIPGCSVMLAASGSQGTTFAAPAAPSPAAAGRRMTAWRACPLAWATRPPGGTASPGLSAAVRGLPTGGCTEALCDASAGRFICVMLQADDGAHLIKQQNCKNTTAAALMCCKSLTP